MEAKHDHACTHCGSSEQHQACPVCEGRGCLSARELAEKLGLRDAVDAAALTAEAVARAFDERALRALEAVKKGEAQRVAEAVELERQKQAARDAEVRAEVLKLREQLQANGNMLAEERAERKAAEARVKAAEEQITKRRSQPAAMGRTAERGFATMIGEHVDFRLSEKLPKAGDYDLWLSVADGTGGLREIDEPMLVDIKLDTAALHPKALANLLRDCKERGRRFGVLVADRLDEVTETFGAQRMRIHHGVFVLFTSVDTVVSDLRLVGMFWSKYLAETRQGDGPSADVLATQLAEVGRFLDEADHALAAVASVLEKQAETIRTKIIKKLFTRIKAIAAGGSNGAPALAETGTM